MRILKTNHNMKKGYQTKTAMAKDLAEKLGIPVITARSQLSRELKVEVEYHEFEIEGETHEIKFYVTPEIKVKYKLK